MEDVWSVKDGMLLCKGKPPGYIFTKKNDFENYVLTVEWRWPGKGGNNGVLVHVRQAGRARRVAEVAGGAVGTGTPATSGSSARRSTSRSREARQDRRHINLTDDSEKPLGEWNAMEITCRGDEVIVKVNGKLVNHATKLQRDKGRFALQSEGTPIEFRKVELKKLKE